MNEFKPEDMAIYVGRDSEIYSQCLIPRGSIVAILSTASVWDNVDLGISYFGYLVGNCFDDSWIARPHELKPITDPDAEIETVNDEELTV